MRKLKLQMQITLDGFVADPSGGVEHVFGWMSKGDVAEHLKNAITGGTLVKAATTRADWENARTSIAQSLSQPEEVYARQAGLQAMISQVDPSNA